ncbi:helix-turn-helix transcriptional regulator [Candidatus Merdisoma sp. JLR.KK011]
MVFADKLQSLRKSKGLSEEEAAEKCNVTRQSVSKWETGVSHS